MNHNNVRVCWWCANLLPAEKVKGQPLSMHYWCAVTYERKRREVLDKKRESYAHAPV